MTAQLRLLEEGEDIEGLLYPVTSMGADMEGLYRYSLTRGWLAGVGRILFCMLNPSVADAIRPDRTVRRCIDFAQRWGFAELEVVNLFALISTNPAGLRTAEDPVGPRNDNAIQEAVERCDRLVVGWGDRVRFDHKTHPKLRGRDEHVRRLLAAAGAGRSIECMGLTAGGQPRHPLMLKKTTPLQPYGAHV